jgi:hypothetical protein
MAKFVCEFDTVEKTVAVTKDGNAVADVRGFEVYPSYMDDDDYCVRVVQGTFDEAEKLSTMVVMCASVAGEDKAVEVKSEKEWEKAKADLHMAAPGLTKPAPETPARSLAKAIASARKGE